MPASSIAAALREVAAILGGGSVYLVTSAATAGVCAAAAEALGRNAFVWGFCGVFLPTPPLYWYFSSDRVIRKRLRYYRALHDDRLITPQQYAQLRRSLVRWYMVRQFGRAGLELPLDDDPPTAPPPPG